MIEFQNRQIKLADGSRVMICRIVGSIDGSTLSQFEDKLLGFLEAGFTYLILVFSQVKYINSTGMGVLVKMADRFHDAKGEIYLVDVPEKLIALFNMLGLLALIKLSKTEEEALKNFKGYVGEQEKQKNSRPASKNISSPPPNVGNKTTTRSPATKESEIPQSAPRQTTVRAKNKAPNVKKMFIIKCQHCQTKISLGVSLRPGTYKCPRCMTFFKVLPTGKARFSPVDAKKK